MPHHTPLGGPAPVKGIMVGFGPLKQKWREVAEKKARMKGLRNIMKEGIGVKMVEYYVKNLEEQAQVKMGREENKRRL